ncbi:MAG: flagellar protein [Lachnospiraceae bacterium]|nr:flagellar protein [Lachnospiraceae bacterium]
MNARNCRRCGKIFNYVVGMPICPACKEAMEAKFQEVKEYIREHKGVGIQEVAEACDVDPQQIRQWLRDDRLEMTEDSAIMLNCEGCGTPIRSGRFCDKCKAQMLSGLQQVSKSMRPGGGSGQGGDDPNGPRWRS